MMKSIGKFHVLTDTVVQNRFSHLEIARMALRGGADTIQFRQKSGSTREMIQMARQLKWLCSDHGVPFIVNDRIDVAIASEADGVHLGQDDFPIPLARRLLGKERIIGGSAANLEEARRCVSEGADYIGFGPVYPTTSKPDASPATGIELLQKVVQAVNLPIIAIGGVNAANTPHLIKAGAYGIAVIAAVCCQENPEQAARALSLAIRESL
ncbi:MAG: thiamine phosphate synthase [Candidatus Aminicenantales bacterium]